MVVLGPHRAGHMGPVEMVVVEAGSADAVDPAGGAWRAVLDAFFNHDTIDRLPQIAAPTLVLAGGRDMTSRPELCRAVAELIPGARFEVMEEEVPDQWNVISISCSPDPARTPRSAVSAKPTSHELATIFVCEIVPSVTQPCEATPSRTHFNSAPARRR
jgi:hypothetical protein